jgi:hypothetical protein
MTAPSAIAVSAGAGSLPSRSELWGAATALHAYLLRRHWRDDALVGPDCGVRLNYRVGRFLKSYLRVVPWRDDLCYQQAQGYWILANLRLHEAEADERWRAVALACARATVARQSAEGAWEYPNRAWRGRVANAEGTWAAIGLLEAYRATGEASLLGGAMRWHRFLTERIGYQDAPGGRAANYFAAGDGPPVPNTSAFVLRFLAELADVTDDAEILAPAPAMVSFLTEVQRPSGELPYQVGQHVRLPHFQCPQYHAFQCIDLMRYADLTGDTRAREVIGAILGFLRRSVCDDGTVPYACDRARPHVTYHLAAVAAALSYGAPGDAAAVERAGRVVRRLLGLQREDGSFAHSRGDYRVLSDRRAYPRHLAMVLLHLLLLCGRRTAASERRTP